MPRELAVFVPSFKGGLDVKSSVLELAPDAVPWLENFDLTETGALTKRPGEEQLATTIRSEPVHSLIRYYRPSDRERFLLAFSGPGVYRYAGSSWEPLRYDLHGSPQSHVLWHDTLYFTSGVQKVYAYDGTTASDTQIPLGKHLHVHGDRMWVAHPHGYPTYVYFSELEDETAWQDPNHGTTNLMTFGGTTGQITGLATSYGRMVVFTERGIEMLSGYDESDWTRTTLTDDLGCIAPQTLQEADGRHIFLSHRGVFMMDFDSLDRISGPVQPLLDRLTLEELSQAVAVTNKTRYFLAIPSAAQGPLDLVLIYDWALKSWTAWTGINVGSFVSLEAPGDPGHLVYGAGDSGRVYSFTGSSAGVATRVVTRRFGLEAPDYEKVFRRLQLTGTWTTPPSVTWSVEGGAKQGTFDLTHNPKSLPLEAMGQDCSFEITESANADYKLLQLAVDVRAKRRSWS